MGPSGTLKLCIAGVRLCGLTPPLVCSLCLVLVVTDLISVSLSNRLLTCLPHRHEVSFWKHESSYGLSPMVFPPQHQKATNAPCAYSPSIRIIGRPRGLPSIYISSGDLNSGLHTCQANTLPTESSSQPNFVSFKFDGRGYLSQPWEPNTLPAMDLLPSRPCY